MNLNHWIALIAHRAIEWSGVIPVTVICTAVVLLFLVFVTVMGSPLTCCRRDGRRRHCLRLKAACRILFYADTGNDKLELSAENIQRELEARQKLVELDGKNRLVELECAEKLAELETLEAQCLVRRNELRELEDGTWEWSTGLGRICELSSQESALRGGQENVTDLPFGLKAGNEPLHGEVPWQMT